MRVQVLGKVGLVRGHEPLTKGKRCLHTAMFGPRIPQIRQPNIIILLCPKAALKNVFNIIKRDKADPMPSREDCCSDDPVRHYTDDRSHPAIATRRDYTRRDH